MSTRTSLVPSWASASASASAGPPWSALMMIRSCVTAPSLSAREMSSSVPPRAERRFCASRSSRWRFCAISRASLASDTTRKVSPADGTPSKPRIWIGIDGPTSLTGLPRSSKSARTRPENLPQMKLSPTVQRALLHQHGGERALAGVEGRLDHRALRLGVGIGLELENFGLQQDLVEQFRRRPCPVLAEISALEHVAAELLEHDVLLQQVLLDLQHVGGRAGRSC